MSHHRRSMAGLSLAVGFALLIVQGAGSGMAVAAPQDAVRLAQNDPDQPDDPGSAAALLVRVDRLENKIRSMTGQIEQLQFQNKRLEDALRKMQQDVDFRFQDLNRAPGGKPPLQKRGDLSDPTSETLADATPDTGSTSPVETDPATSSPARSPKRSDAFDPAAEPNAVGAPKPLGTAASSATLPPLRSSIGSAGAVAPPPVRTVAPTGEDALHAPLDLTHGALAASATPGRKGRLAGLRRHSRGSRSAKRDGLERATVRHRNTFDSTTRGVGARRVGGRHTGHGWINGAGRRQSDAGWNAQRV